MEMRCYRETLRISYKDYVTNEEVCAKIQPAMRPHKDLLTIHEVWVKPSCKAQGKGEEDKGQGRQRKRWEDNFREWSGLEFTKSQRAVENGEEWL